MPRVEAALFDIGGLDQLARQDTPVHRLDPRAKVLTALAFIITVVSFHKYDVSALLPLILYPVVLMSAGHLPPKYLLGKVLLASPLALTLCLPNPLLDRATLMYLGPVAVSGGWVSFTSIMLRFVLTLSAALMLISTTGLDSVCRALTSFRVPQVLVVQLLLFYRYLFVLIDEASHMHKAWALRSMPGKRMTLRVFGSLVGQLLLRSIDRAQRVHRAMLGRGFTGEFHQRRALRFGFRDLCFVTGWAAFFMLARLLNLPHLLGGTAIGVFR